MSDLDMVSCLAFLVPVLKSCVCVRFPAGAGDAEDAGLEWRSHANANHRAVHGWPAAGSVAAAGNHHDGQIPAAVGRVRWEQHKQSTFCFFSTRISAESFFFGCKTYCARLHVGLVWHLHGNWSVVLFFESVFTALSVRADLRLKSTCVSEDGHLEDAAVARLHIRSFCSWSILHILFPLKTLSGVSV